MSASWERYVVEARSGGAWAVPAGGLIRVSDVEGGQTGDVFIVDAADLNDGLSNGRSFDYNDSIALTVGAKLYSKRSRVLATITADDVGRHDFLYAPCSQEMYEIRKRRSARGRAQPAFLKMNPIGKTPVPAVKRPSVINDGTAGALTLLV